LWYPIRQLMTQTVGLSACKTLVLHYNVLRLGQSDDTLRSLS
jgi:hypothetical protein